MTAGCFRPFVIDCSECVFQLRFLVRSYLGRRTGQGITELRKF